MRRLASVVGVLGLALLGVAALPHKAEAWWRGGVGFGVVLPPVVYAPPPTVVYAPPPAVVYAPPPRRVWVPPHWEGPYWVRGHWA
jgi:hypothetical protein